MPDPLNGIVGQLARQGGGVTDSILSSVGYRHDSKGRRQWLTREDGTRWEYGYNDRDEVESGKKRLPNNGAFLAGQQFAYNYDAIGNRTTAQYGGDENGANLRDMTYTLDADHDQTIAGSVNQYGKIEYSGHVSLIGYGDSTTEVTPSDPSLLSETDQADQSNRWWREMRLQTSAQTSGLQADLTFKENDVPLADSQGQLWFNPTSYEPEYDEDGNLTADARWNYTWNGENRLVSMVTKANAITAGHPWVRLTFTYDWQGRRVQKKVEEASPGNVTKDLRYFYDGWNLIAEYEFSAPTAQFTLQNSYLWGLDLSGTEQGAGGVGGLLAVNQYSTEDDSQITTSFFPAYDGNGNIIAWINESGAVAQRRDYDPFGNLISKQGNIESLNYGFSTKYTDEETGLCYYGYRYYDPVTGRWPSRDPIEEDGGVNLYGFVGNDGVNRVDVLGMFPFSAWGRSHMTARMHEGRDEMKKTLAHEEKIGGMVDGISQLWYETSGVPVEVRESETALGQYISGSIVGQRHFRIPSDGVSVRTAIHESVHAFYDVGGWGDKGADERRAYWTEELYKSYDTIEAEVKRLEKHGKGSFDIARKEAQLVWVNLTSNHKVFQYSRVRASTEWASFLPPSYSDVQKVDVERIKEDLGMYISCEEIAGMLGQLPQMRKYGICFQCYQGRTHDVNVSTIQVKDESLIELK